MAPLFVLLTLAAGSQVAVPPPPGSDGGEGLRARWQAIRDDESEALEALAREAEAGGRAAEAQAIRARITPPIPEDGPERFVPLPEYVPGPDATSMTPAPAPAGVDEVQDHTVESLMDLARRAADPAAGRYGLAIACLRDVLSRDPQHREARRLIGYVEHDGGWATPHAARNLEDGFVLHPVYGWVPESWVEHLERGELPGIASSAGREAPWLPAAEADALRRDFARRPWQISTEHFDIATNVPLAEAIAFGRRLEHLREIFLALLADVLGPENLDLDDRFRSPDLWATPSKVRHKVWYFADRQEYIDFFGRLGRDEAGSLGYYMPAQEARGYRLTPRSYFFRNQGDPLDGLPTLFHEASHQLLFELAGPSQYERNVGQYWIWEGLGTYFETLTPTSDGAYEIGGRVGPRMARARDDLASGRSVPVAELLAMSQVRFQDHQAIYAHYAEAMALVAYLMHAERGAYRDGFLDYVADAYRGRFRPGGAARPLPERLGIPAGTLDTGFRRFLSGGSEDGDGTSRRPSRPSILAPGGNLRPMDPR